MSDVATGKGVLQHLLSYHITNPFYFIYNLQSSRIRTINRRPRLTIPSMFNNMWDVKEPKHYSKRVGREVPGVVAVLCVVSTGPMLIAVTTITEMVILYKYVE